MNEKDRLIGLLQSVPTNHYGDIGIETAADHLIANNITIPPVSVGQTVYIIRRPKGSLPWIAECTVGEVHVEYTADGKVCWFKSHNYEALEEDIGHWVFLTREEAEQALKGAQHEE